VKNTHLEIRQTS